MPMKAIFEAARQHRLSGRVGLAAVLAFAALTLCSTSASAVTVGGEHVLDPTLSLTGGTAVSKIDPVPDPGETHPAEPFQYPSALATDTHGDLYVSNMGSGSNSEGNWTKGAIDVFDSSGDFVTEIHDEEGPSSIAVDSEGSIYVAQENSASENLVRYTPSAYPPVPSTTYTLTTVLEKGKIFLSPVAVDRANDHLFVISADGELNEYGSATEGNPLLRENITGSFGGATEHHLAVSSTTGDIFVTDEYLGEYVVDVFDREGGLIERINGSELPSGEFESWLSVAVDEATGELIVGEVYGVGLHRFVPRSGGGYEYVLDPTLEAPEYVEPRGIAVANGVVPNADNVYVDSVNREPHVFAFEPAPEVGPPVVSVPSVNQVGGSEARFSAEVTPHGFATQYRFEYVPEQVYAEDVEALGAGHGFDDATSTTAASLPAGATPVAVSEAAGGLSAGTAYRVRVMASNHCEKGEPERSCVTEGEAARFATYPGAPVEGGCPNESLREGVSATLPDCRAYELVSPSDTNGREPEGLHALSPGPGSFATDLASPAGDSVIFTTDGGGLPGTESNGVADGYEARRSPSGWMTSAAGMAGDLSQRPLIGGASPDHEYWFWTTGFGGKGADHGSLVIEGLETRYVRLPDHSFLLFGQGALGSDPQAEGRFISAHGAHLIFTSAKPLVEGASPEGVTTIYDRPPAGEPQVVSVLPDGQAPQSGATVAFVAASADGSAVAFTVREGGVTSMYEHRVGGGTLLVAAGTFERAGLSSDGNRLAYLNNGDAYSFDADSDANSALGSGGESTIVNVSADGSHVYFVSPRMLSAGLSNPETKPETGEPNLYVWDVATEAITFIATLDSADMSSEEGAYGLEYWQWHNGEGIPEPGLDTSRVSRDGSTIVFESHADLTSYRAGGHVEIYRYEEGEGVSCVSCNPTMVAASGDARLQINPHATKESAFETLAPLSARTAVANLSEDGRTVFFQTPEPLVAGDVDGTDDVYEWEAQGSGGCTRSGGCVALISSGRSGGPNYVYAVTPSGSDVFFTTADRLTEADGDPTRSIYDARIAGGFPESAEEPCGGEECKDPLAVPPAAIQFATQTSIPSSTQSPPEPVKKVAGKTRSTHAGCLGKRKPAHRGKVTNRARKAGKAAGKRRVCERSRARGSRHRSPGRGHRQTPVKQARGGAR
jgi:hypothetical protein